ncbi:MAG: hypothetical protein PHG61_10995, partial [Candidatus Marinimicrobia bacterium]|nr:hypothetical protein [Candidatus Neomarinimicrobiota bacterium]
MLEPHSIPIREPILRVGIFLPSDNSRTISTEIPQGQIYHLKSADESVAVLQDSEQIEFNV